MTSTPTPEKILGERFGFTSFRPGQREALHALVTHRGTLAVFPTGAGKSLVYQLGALLFEGVTLVISPLIALMKDQIDDLDARGIPAARLDSTLNADQSRAIEQRLRDGSLKLLYVAPERFANERFLSLLKRLKLAIFAVDEAHCISEWGHNFRPDYLKLAETARSVGAERVLALTATATPAVALDICAKFGIPADAMVVTPFHRPNLHLYASPTAPAEREHALAARVRRRPPGSGIVYVTLQRTAERVAEVLAQAGLPARAYHAGMVDDIRAEVQEWWKASDRGIVVATIAFGMGIDKPDVRYVYHYDLPKSLEGYAQEIGRAGRDGAPAVVEALGSLEDMATLENFVYGDTPTRTSLGSLVEDLLGRGTEFDVSHYQLAQVHDIRQLVLRTALTYLELDGVLRQGTPFFAGYRAKPLDRFDMLTSGFPAPKRDFVDRVFAAAKKGREWYSFDARAVSDALGEERSRVAAMLDYLATQGGIVLQPSDVRHRYVRLAPDAEPETLVESLVSRFERSEQREIQRIKHITKFLSLDRCQTNALLKYFGETRVEPCGHCGACKRGHGAEFPPLPLLPPIPDAVDVDALTAVIGKHPVPLREPRQQARFLCGLSSPATTREKLSRHPLFGALADRRFPEVLAWCEARAG